MSEAGISKCLGVLYATWVYLKSMLSRSICFSRNSSKCSRSWRTPVFSKWDLPYNWVFWGCDFQLVFAQTHRLNKNPCFNVSAAVQKRRQMFEKLKKTTRVRRTDNGCLLTLHTKRQIAARAWRATSAAAIFGGVTLILCMYVWCIFRQTPRSFIRALSKVMRHGSHGHGLTRKLIAAKQYKQDLSPFELPTRVFFL